MVNLNIKRKIAIVIPIVLFTLLLDQVSKFLVVRFLPLGERHQVLGNFLWFTHIKNPKGAFGIPLPSWFPFEIVAFLAIILLIIVAAQEKKTLYLPFYGLLLGGALGNLIDRIRTKEVTDFIDIGISSSLRWPIFNLADFTLSIGIMSLLFLTFIEGKKKEENGNSDSNLFVK